MASVSSIVSGMATRLESISGLRVQEQVLDTAPVPVALIGPPSSISYDEVMARGADLYTFSVRVLVARASERSAQVSLFDYLSGTGTKSVKAAFEADKTLDGSADTCRVTAATGIGIYSYGEVDYLGSDFTVEVIA